MIIAKTQFIELFGDKEFVTESGKSLRPVTVAYQTYGELNESADNAILICHALTGNAHAAGIQSETETDVKGEFDFLYAYSKSSLGKTGWWDGLIGPGKAFDTDRFFVICPNILGSCYGTTGPSSINPSTGKSYNRDFPLITVRDVVNVQYEMLKTIGVKQLAAISGGSLGGMQAFEWSIMYPDFVKCVFPIGASYANSAWAIALNMPAKQAIMNDPDFNGGAYVRQPEKGLAIARMTGMISYRSMKSYNSKFGRRLIENSKGLEPGNVFEMQSYLDYQGKKLVSRFDANSYLCVTNMTDLHDISRGRGNIEDVLKSIRVKTICIGISSDILYPAAEIKEVAAGIPNAEYAEIVSDMGHDAFLMEFEQLEKIIRKHLK